MSVAPKKNSSKSPSQTSDAGEIKAPEPLPFPIVGIGASAGGLEAFTELLKHLPKDSGLAFVLVQHLAPDHPSHLTDLLAHATKMSVCQVKDGMLLARNHVYVMPPNANMELARGKFQLTPRGNERIPHPIDGFFRSLAREQTNGAIGVVLSGTGSDGMVGLEEIKAAGGITFAQDEKSARFSGMPLSAASGTVDFILPPDKIAGELARIGRDPYVAQSTGDTAEATPAENEKEFQRILMLLRSQMGVDFRQYRDTTIKRRIQRRMLVHSRPTVKEYVSLLERNPAELKALFEDMLIGVTSFFRDAEMFEALKTNIFPEVTKAGTGPIRVWVVGCSTGQEVYSLAIALLEFLEQKSATRTIQIFATDINDSLAIEKARRGLYPESIQAEVSPERLRRFFTKEDGGFRVSKTIREMCVFARQNIAADPPFSRIDLISCRNVLIYLTPPLQRRVISTLHYALNLTGYLVLGSSETVGANCDMFELVDRKRKIYSKKGVAVRPFSHFAAEDLKVPAPAAGRPNVDFAPVLLDVHKEADRILLGRYAPAGVLINSNLEVLQFRGKTSAYLELPTGEASFNLLKMARGNLPHELGRAVRQAQKDNAPVRRLVRIGEADSVQKIHLEVIPVRLSASENCFLILFEDGEKASPPSVVAEKKTAKNSQATSKPSAQKEAELEQLRQDLKATQEYLQTVIEHQDAANEELRCAHEEVLSSNEELQSTNEQLGTAKEELQSTNEELATLNEELQTRNGELNQLNNDLNNLLGSAQVPILMLGNDLRIRRFNLAATRFLNLTATDIGRPITTIHSPLLGPELEPALADVISQIVPKEMEVRDRDGHWFSLRLNPYRTADNRIDGAILELVDIDALKRIQKLQSASTHEALSELEDRFRVATDNAPVLIWMSGPDKLRTWFNRPWFEFTGRAVEQERGNGWAENVHPDDLPRCVEVYETTFDARREFKIEYRLRRHDGEYRWMLDRGVPRYRGSKFVGYIGSCADITERKRLEEQLADSLEREKIARHSAEVANHSKDDFLAALSHELRTPLNPVLLLASDAARNPDLPPKAREDFERVRKNVELEARLIDDLLDLTRITCGKLVLNQSIVDVHGVLQDAIANVLSEVKEKHLNLVLNLQAGRSLVRGDAVRLQQVFWNVLKNAVKFTPNGGKIEVHTAVANENHLRVEIVDTGLGLTPEELGHVFGAFAQGDHARGETHRFGGLGLGLAISSKLVQLHTGSIHATSEGRGLGSAFVVELPLTDKDGRSQVEDTAPESSPVASTDGAGVRILLVEDHEPTRTALAQLLIRRHYQVLAAASVAEALKIAGTETCDFVISDLGLPDGSGNRLMAMLRDRHGLKGVALTGYGTEQDIKESQSAGFVAHLTKPVNIQSLETALVKAAPRRA